MGETPKVKHLLISEMLFNKAYKGLLSDAFPNRERIVQDMNGYHMPFIRVSLDRRQEEIVRVMLDIKGVSNIDDYIAADKGSVVVKDSDSPLHKEKGRGTLSDIQETLLSLSRVTGIEFILHTSQTLVPQHATQHQINVILGAPPGSGNLIKRTAHPETGRSFSIWDVGRATCEGAARGWGLVIEAPDEKPIAQIIGRNFYLLVPADKIGMRLLPQASGADLFGYAMRMAWNAFVKGVQEPAQEPLDTPEAMQMFLGMSESIEAARRVKSIEDLTEELSEIKARYQEVLNKIRTIEGLLKPNVSRVEKIIIDPPSWDEATGDPLFERMYTVEHLLHVQTKPVVVEGRMLGPYVARFDCNVFNDHWNVVIYCAGRPCHPEAIPHPHIGERGTACFGNVGLLIDEALIAHNIPRAIKLVLQWLARGYDPELTRHKIEEWPLAEASSGKEAA